MESLTGKVALVTGGGRGIGRAITLSLARAGCDVAINYRERQSDAESAAKDVQNCGRRSVAMAADVSYQVDDGPVSECGNARKSRSHVCASKRSNSFCR